MGGEVTDRCPNALRRIPFVLEANRLYGGWRKGLTPNGRGLRHETACYLETMRLLEALEAEAESWYLEQVKARRKNGGNI